MRVRKRPRDIAFAHHERRQMHDGPRYVAIFAENIGTHLCRYPDCGRKGSHTHPREVADMTAAELLALSESDFDKAWEDLHYYHPDLYSDTDTARLELMCERDEDIVKASDVRGRRVA